MALPADLSALLAEFIEQDIRLHQQLVSAAANAGDNQIHAREEIVNWNLLGQLLRAMAHDTSSADPWKRVGIAQFEGDIPTTELFDQRVTFGNLMPTLSHNPEWTEEDKVRAQTFAQQLEEERRKAYQMQCKSPDTAKEWLETIGESDLVMRAPSDNHVFQSLMATLTKHILKQERPPSIAFLVPFVPLPGCDAPELTLDLWSRPIFAQKYNNMITRTEFLRQPTRCVFLGATLNWQPTLATHEPGHIICVDCAYSEEVLTHRALMMAPGSTAKGRRLLFMGIFNVGAVTALDVRLFINHLKQQGNLSGVLIGTRSRFKDSAGMLIDMGHARAVSQLSHMTDEVALVSRRLAIMKSSRTAKDWGREITEQVGKFPTEAIEGIRFRGARNGGRAWVKPAILDAQLRAARAWEAAVDMPRHQKEHLTRSVTIKVAGFSSNRSGVSLGILMEQVARLAGVTLERRSADQPLLDKEWDLQIATNGVWNGSILIQMPDLTAAAALRDSAQGSGFEVDGLRRALEAEIYLAPLGPPSALRTQ
ncbi:unnamed protein product [Prorocentrum cordatum]|uniref:Uncharacterized protein n=1 Tax=Prorocentrum cordatum TaxID=2364126 RepID=A0ABN9U069_9DINO|nr:unnamed protein product [Polarella glacialis]